MLELILGALFVLILGNYAYTFRVERRLNAILENELQHLRDRLEDLEANLGDHKLPP